MKNKITAFSLGEVLVTLAIVGVIAALILPTIKQMQPDRQKMLFKKAYTNVERVVTEIINDDYLYPEATGYVGLDNTTSVTLNDTSYGGSNKFCKLFALKLNNINSDDDDINCPYGALSDGSAGTPSFTTNDGIEFYIPNTTFATDTTISVDVNGEKAPNCKYSASSCSTPDRFEIIVSADGGIEVEGDLEKSFLKSTSVTKDDPNKKNIQTN